MRFLAEILENSPLCEGIYKLVVEASEAAKVAQPGQFAHIALPDGEKILRRPISICDAEDGCLTLVYAVRGGGTMSLSRLAPGEKLDILAPLGHGFELSGFGNIAAVGGGIGIFPLLYALKRSNASKKTAFLGFRCRDTAVLLGEFGKVCDLHISTEDGSLGKRCFVTDILAQSWEGFDAVLACGPKPMLKAVNRICASQGIDPQISVEERMGCGLGGCLVCACRVKSGEGYDYAHVCVDGPVFLGSKLDWEEDA